MQGVQSNYDIDLFRHLVEAAAKLLGTRDLASPSLRVIADHIRASSFLVADGVTPSNEGRGYVLRRIMRRAMRHGHKFGAAPTFFAELLPALTEVMGAAYPELRSKQAFIREVLLKEGEQFARTLATGMALLDEAIAALDGGRVVDGATVFKLHDTYGFPPDLTADVLREKGLSADMAGYEREMDAQRERARAASRFGVDLRGGPDLGTQHRILRLRSYRRRLARSRPCSRMASPCSPCSPARKARWCWNARRSTPNPAGRSATPACCSSTAARQRAGRAPAARALR